MKMSPFRGIFMKATSLQFVANWWFDVGGM